MKQNIILVVVCLLIAPLAQANAQLGAKIFKSQCISCHTTAQMLPRIPVLYGQEPKYIKIQLENFKKNIRIDRNLHSMNTIAKNLKAEEIDAVATYLAGLDPCDIKMTIDPNAPDFMTTYKAGAKLVQVNNCMHCHGSFHHAAPRLHGQKKKYLEFTLQEFLSGDRDNPYMKRIIPILNDESIKQISTYFNAQRLMRECDF